MLNSDIIASMITRNQYAGVLIEGSSTAYGFCDESMGVGYGSRIQKNIDAYNKRSKNRTPRWVYSFLNAQPNRLLPQVVRGLEQHVDSARSHVMAGRLVGIFAVGGRLDYAAQKLGKKATMATWKQSLVDLDRICLEHDIKPVVFGVPVIPPHIPLNDGRPADIEMLEWSLTVTRNFVEQDMEVPYISFEEVMGDELADCMAADQKHANSRGYDKIYRHLLPYIHSLLELEEPFDVFASDVDAAPTSTT